MRTSFSFCRPPLPSFGRMVSVLSLMLTMLIAAQDATGVSLSIPMPGHAPADAKAAQSIRDAVTALQDLILAHDVVFLLTDSRESRWLPTVMCAAYEKVCSPACLALLLHFFDIYLCSWR